MDLTVLVVALRFLGVDEQCWQGLQETAGSSSQIRHHVGAVRILFDKLTKRIRNDLNAQGQKPRNFFGKEG